MSEDMNRTQREEANKNHDRTGSRLRCKELQGTYQLWYEKLERDAPVPIKRGERHDAPSLISV